MFILHGIEILLHVWFILADTSWSRLSKHSNACFLKLWHTTSLLSLDMFCPFPHFVPFHRLMQDKICFLGCECTLLHHIQLLIHQQPQVLLKGLLSICSSLCHQGLPWLRCRPILQECQQHHSAWGCLEICGRCSQSLHLCY